MSNFFYSLAFLLITLFSFHPKSYAQFANGNSSLEGFCIKLTENEKALNRLYFNPYTPERIERFNKFYNKELAALNEFDYSIFNVQTQVDYHLLKNTLRSKIEQNNQNNKVREELGSWINYDLELYKLLTKRNRGKKLNAEEVAQTFENISEILKIQSKKLASKKYPFNRRLANGANSIVKKQLQTLRHIHSFYNGYDPNYTWWVKVPFQKLENQLTEYQKIVADNINDKLSNDPSGIIGTPIGEEELARQLERAFIPYSAEQLIDIAKKEFDWCKKERNKLTNQLGLKKWKDALEKLKNTSVKVGDQPEMILGLYNESIAFVKAKNLITIPKLAEETWRVTMLSPERQRIAPFFLGGELLQIAYPTEEMTHSEKQMSIRGNNPHFSRAVVHHEIIPGHHLQQYMLKRHKNYRKFNNPFWMEGWALYWEMLLYEKDFAKTPEDKLGMVFWRSHRCARIIFSLNYHLGKWTPQQCIDFLVNEVGHEKANAEGEVRRSFESVYGPLYQIAYMVGGLQFKALHNEITQENNNSEKAFHDFILQQNAMPIEMLRILLKNTKTPKNYKTNWNFYKNE